MEKWKKLCRLGLNEYQARALTCLVESEELTAEEVSEESGIPYTKIYSVLKNLQEMGMVITTEERPKKFIAKHKDEVIGSLIERKREKFELMRKQAMETKRKLGSTKFAGPQNKIYEQETLA